MRGKSRPRERRKGDHIAVLPTKNDSSLYTSTKKFCSHHIRVYEMSLNRLKNTHSFPTPN